MSRPQLNTDTSLWPGVAAVGLFVVLAGAFLSAQLPEPTGFGADAQIVKSIGAAMFAIDPAQVTADGGNVGSESFLVLFIMIAVVLDAALDGSLMLAKREDDETSGGDS